MWFKVWGCSLRHSFIQSRREQQPKTQSFIEDIEQQFSHTDSHRSTCLKFFDFRNKSTRNFIHQLSVCVCKFEGERERAKESKRDENRAHERAHSSLNGIWFFVSFSSLFFCSFDHFALAKRSSENCCVIIFCVATCINRKKSNFTIVSGDFTSLLELIHRRWFKYTRSDFCAGIENENCIFNNFSRSFRHEWMKFCINNKNKNAIITYVIWAISKNHPRFDSCAFVYDRLNSSTVYGACVKSI